MKRSRKHKLLIILVLVISIASLSIGFASFSSALNISSSTSVSANSSLFSVKFSTEMENLVEENVEPSDMSPGISVSAGVIDNAVNPTITNLSATFTHPGQYVEYTFFARNEGEYTAYLNSVNFYGKKHCSSSYDITANVQSACDSINLKVIVDGYEYTDTTEISNHSLAKNAGEEIKLRIEYASDGGWADNPFFVSFENIIMVYSTVDNQSFVPDNSVLNYPLLVNVVSKNAVLDSSLNFSSDKTLSDINNVAWIRQGTENSLYPIYYYRGNVTQNNITFANFCWKVVRTTDTGGVKILYNGASAKDGSCNNIGVDTAIASDSFAGGYQSIGLVGYMYGDLYYADCKDLSSQAETYLYGNNVFWDGENYQIIDTIESGNFLDDKATLAERYHYTCFNNSGVCKNVYYIQGFGSSESYPARACYAELTKGVKIEDAVNKMFENNNDSKVKTILDAWYASNLLEYADKIEDTVFCNDRTIYSGTLLGKDSLASNNVFLGVYRNSLSKNSVQPSFDCPNIRDSFTVNSAFGNGKLTYPIGLLTADELTFAGNGQFAYSKDSFLASNSGERSFRLMTPYSFSNYISMMYLAHPSGMLGYNHSNYGFLIRPSISLNGDVIITGGNGTVDSPYVVE